MSRRGATVSAGVPWSGADTSSRLGTGWEPAVLLLLTVMLLAIGIVSVYSASAVMAQSHGLPDYHFVVRQVTGAALGLVLLVGTAFLDYRRLRMFAWPMLLVLLAVLFVMILPGMRDVAEFRNGAGRWLRIGPVAIQPSEFAKLVLIIWTAALAVKKQDRLGSLFRGLLPFLVVWAPVSLLIFLQPSMSAALLVVLLSALVVFAAGARIGHFILLGCVAVPILWSQVGAAAYRMRRIVAFFDPATDPAGMSYQINQALIAIGSGGIFGRGFGRGVQKFGYLPEPHNDFLFAMIGEEWGFIGALVVISLFAAFALVGFRIARYAPDLFGFLLAVGVTCLIAVQAMLHIAVNLALIPTTGVTLPFLSYGRSSLLVCLLGTGILMNVGRRAAEVAE
ncbi:MAG TPA: putative lipid II flippase FtsW [Longimicrobiales bacterium]|nr:putative lipid II flippase FtsW [Longimicrobiales bacterium]